MRPRRRSLHFCEVKALYEARRDNTTSSNKKGTLIAARRYIDDVK